MLTKIRASLVLLCVSLAGLPALAQYPNKPINVIVPMAAGGSTDTLSRFAAKKLQEHWGQPVIVENKIGAAGIVGSEAVVRATPDGYTVLMASGGALTVSPHMFTKFPFDPNKDLIPVTHMVNMPLVLVVNPAIKANNLQELLALAKSGKKLSMGSYGVGTPPHLATEALKLATGISVTHVPYKGSSLVTQALLSGEIDAAFNVMASMGPHIEAGRLRPIAVAAMKRMPSIPNVATVDEQGLKNFQAAEWLGLLAPAGTSRAIVNQLSTEMNRILETPDMKERMDKLGFIAAGGTPEQFSVFLREDTQRWGKVVKDAKIPKLQ
jgi:tripartite-type tricarboxylate transporter receptor subunit TctC